MEIFLSSVVYRSTQNIKLLITVLLIITGIFPTRATAGSDARQGTAGAQELLIPHGSRGTALGGAVVADVKGGEAMYWNPAGSAYLSGREVMFSHLDYIADMKYTYFGALVPAGIFGNIGINVRVLDVGDIIVTREDAPDGTGEIISPEFITLGFVYSRQVTDRVSFGTSLNIIREKIINETANGVALDVGFQYRPGLGGLSLGVVLKNLGPTMKFNGGDLDNAVRLPGDNIQAGTKSVRLTLAEFELPSYIQFGTSYNWEWSHSKSVIFSSSFRNNSFSQDELNGGIEVNFSDLIFLRGGYSHSSDTNYLYGPTFGFGLNLKLGSSRLSVDYSIAQTKYFANNQWITFKLLF